MTHKTVLVLLLVLPGVVTMVFSGYFALLDWAQLQTDYENFRSVSASGADLREVFVAWAAQDLHRVNLAADGTWFLLGSLLMGLGVHGLYQASHHVVPKSGGDDDAHKSDRRRRAEPATHQSGADG